MGGYRINRHHHEHVHQVLFEQMTDAELEHLAETAEWPARLQDAVGGAAQFTTPPALPAPTVNGGASRANGGTTRGGRGR